MTEIFHKDALQGISILITGAGSGIGLAIARRLASVGATVAICDCSQAALDAARAAEPRLATHRIDVSDSDAASTVVQRLAAESGRIDVLVNNAGIAGPRCALEDITDEDWEATLRVNLTAPFYFARAVAPIMKRARSGSIINVSTTSARTGLPMRTPYVVSKVGLLGLTQNLARELGPYGIRCNAILPGAVDNERGRATIARVARERGASLEAMTADMLRFVSMRSMINPAEVADLVVFLASAQARHVSGQIIGVCGNVEWEE